MPPAQLEELISGPLLSCRWPIQLNARLADMRTRFIAKQRVQGRFRAISRNGRILLASTRSLDELTDRMVRLRIQTWHRRVLSGDAPSPHGLILWIGQISKMHDHWYDVRLMPRPSNGALLWIDAGGRMGLSFTSHQGDSR